VPNTTVVFNSGGGNVQAGLAMGRLIRKQKMWTEIGSRFPLMIPQNENIDEDVVPYFPEPASPPFAGQCISSCSIAFLGGVVRTVGYASNYRVHQFTGGPQDTPDDLQKADEELSARIVHYLSDMGIAPNWIVYMAKRRGDTINLTIQQMRRLKVVTPRWATRWQITALPDNSGFYLDGATTDAWGTHDIAFTCPPKPTPSVAQAGSSAAVQQKKPPAVVATFSLDPGPHGSAADLISAVVGDDLEVSGNFDPRAFLRSAKKTPPTVVSNRLTSKWELAEPFVTAGLAYIGVAFIFDPAAKLPMRLLRFQGTLDNDLLKEFVATCH
jgi:hypothetical protein